jgi:hypothetical protein
MRTFEFALDGNGNQIDSGAMNDLPNRHDILTGTQLDGTAFPPGEDRTCSNWTSNDEGSAMVVTTTASDLRRRAAHGMRRTPLAAVARKLVSTGGDGLFYCFAAD